MKKNRIHFLVAIITMVMIVFASSCKKDEETEPEKKADPTPVLDKNFSFTVSANTVNFSTTLTGNVWFTDLTTTSTYNVTDGAATCNIPTKGTYPFTCNYQSGTKIYVSDTFDVVIAQDDLSYLEEGLWYSLTGGASGEKHWILDTNKTVFLTPLDFYGDETVGANTNGAWAPFGGCPITEWVTNGANNYVEGHISFDGVTKTAQATLSGTTVTGGFDMTVSTRNPSFLTIPDGNATHSTDFWDYFINTPYLLGDKLSDETANITFSGDSRFPIDWVRAVDNAQILDADFKNVMLMHLDDSSMIVRVKRTSQDGNDAVDQQVWLLYSFIVEEYDYPEKVYYPPFDEYITTTDLTGTWKLNDEMVCGWVKWTTQQFADVWDTREAQQESFKSWWMYGNPSDSLHVDSVVTVVDQASTLVTVTFTASTISVHNAAWDGTTKAITETDYSANYTLDKGILTFDSDITITGGPVTISGTTLDVIVPVNSPAGPGIWIGGRDDAKLESPSVWLVKQ